MARSAHTLFLEAVFTEADRGHALAHGHLTARACGEIATAAGVSRLVPFHFSWRYADDPQTLFEELQAACGCTVLPSMGLRVTVSRTDLDRQAAESAYRVGK